MSFTAAVAELQTALDALSGISEYKDPRVETLSKVGGGILDGAYLLKPQGFRPWPEASGDARLMLVTMRLEVCTLLHNDEITQMGTVSTRAKAIYDAILYTSHTNGCALNSQPSRTQRIGNDRRILWIWLFDLRYTEA